MRDTSPGPGFIRLLTSNQSRLFAYVFALLGDRTQALDVLQETNLVLWRKAGEFKPDTNFGAWALKIAYFQVMAYRRDRNRERIAFDDRFLGGLAEESASRTERWEAQHEAMRECLGGLPPRHRDLIRRRYTEGATVRAIADDVGQAVNTIKQVLFRARAGLIQCMKQKLAARGS